MTIYQAFVKAKIAQIPGSTPRERMRQVAAKWRAVPALQKSSISRPHSASTQKIMKGKGFFTDFVKGVSGVLSFVPGPIGTVAKVVNIGSCLFDGSVAGAGMIKPQITELARQMHDDRAFTSGQESYMEGKRMAEAMHL